MERYLQSGDKAQSLALIDLIESRKNSFDFGRENRTKIDSFINFSLSRWFETLPIIYDTIPVNKENSKGVFVGIDCKDIRGIADGIYTIRIIDNIGTKSFDSDDRILTNMPSTRSKIVILKGAVNTTLSIFSGSDKMGINETYYQGDTFKYKDKYLLTEVHYKTYYLRPFFKNIVINSAALSPAKESKQFIVMTSKDNDTIKIWTVGDTVTKFFSIIQGKDIKWVTISPDNKYILTCTDKYSYLWSKEGKLVEFFHGFKGV